MFYLISIRIIAIKLLRFSSAPVWSVFYKKEKWDLYYRSFNIIMIKNIYPKYSFIKISDAIDLALKNNHIKPFPHYAQGESEQLKEDWGDLYKRYIITDEGLFAFRSKYYVDDWVFNILFSKIATLKALFGTIALYILVQVGYLLYDKGKDKTHKQDTIILIQRNISQKKFQATDTIGSFGFDTIIVEH